MKPKNIWVAVSIQNMPQLLLCTIYIYIQLGGTKVNLDPVTSDGDITTTAFLHGNPRTAHGKALFEAGGDRLPEDFDGDFLAGPGPHHSPQWIGEIRCVEENRNRKPWIFPWNMEVSCKFPLGQSIDWGYLLTIAHSVSTSRESALSMLVYQQIQQVNGRTTPIVGISRGHFTPMNSGIIIPQYWQYNPTFEHGTNGAQEWPSKLFNLSCQCSESESSYYPLVAHLAKITFV